MDLLTNLKTVDPEIQKAIDQELSRQREKLEMIASENIVSKAVMQAQGSVLTNKYAEGYPGKRYYGGCEYVDIVEQLAIDRAKKLFGAEYANVQPHSGAQANTAVYFALLEPGDTILGMNLTDGGHLTHGSPVNISGKYFKIIPYGVDKETERIDYDELERLAKEQEEKDFKSSCQTYTFEQMARNPDNFKGTNVKVTGEVIQALYGYGSVSLRVNITKEGNYTTYYTDTIYVTYTPEEGEDKILEDDIITIYGTSDGEYTYTSTIGASVTLPYIKGKYIEIN